MNTKNSISDAVANSVSFKSVHFFFYTQQKIQKAPPNFSLVVSRWFDFFSVYIGFIIGCKQSLYLENGLKLYFSEWNVRSQHLKKSILSVP